jgi:hypothetical protein
MNSLKRFLLWQNLAWNPLSGTWILQLMYFNTWYQSFKQRKLFDCCFWLHLFAWIPHPRSLSVLSNLRAKKYPSMWPFVHSTSCMKYERQTNLQKKKLNFSFWFELILKESHFFDHPKNLMNMFDKLFFVCILKNINEISKALLTNFSFQ